MMKMTAAFRYLPQHHVFEHPQSLFLLPSETQQAELRFYVIRLQFIKWYVQ
jgi:hypothetical protein